MVRPPLKGGMHSRSYPLPDVFAVPPEIRYVPRARRYTKDYSRQKSEER